MHAQFANGRFTKILTNPPFGENLKVSANDCRVSQLEISKRGGTTYTDMEIGLLFLQRAYDWLREGGWASCCPRRISSPRITRFCSIG